MLANNFLSEKFTCPVPLPPEKSSTAESMAMPPQPALSALSWCAKAKLPSGLPSLKTPDKHIQTWHDHAQWGQKFREEWAKMKQSYPLDMSVSEQGGNKKRAATEVTEGQAGKKAKVANTGWSACPSECLFDSLPDVPLMHEASLPGLKGCELIIAVGQRIFIKNSSKDPVLVRKGLTLAGFYKGKWWLNQAKEATTEQDLLFEVKSAEDMVFMANTHQSLLEVIRAKRATSPADAHVGFHELKDVPKDGCPGYFELKRTHALYFKMDDVPAKHDADGKPKVSCQNLAGVIPVSCWNTWASQLTWSMRWPPTVSKGLQPVRPYITTKCSFTIPPRKSWSCLRMTSHPKTRRRWRRRKKLSEMSHFAVGSISCS